MHNLRIMNVVSVLFNEFGLQEEEAAPEPRLSREMHESLG